MKGEANCDSSLATELDGITKATTGSVGVSMML